MSDKKENTTTEDYHKVEQPVADSVFSEPNNLSEALDHLDAYDDWSSSDEVFQDPEDATTPIIEKHAPYDDADKAKKVKAMGSIPVIPVKVSKNPPKKPKKPNIKPVNLGKVAKDDLTQTEVKKVYNIDLDELMELLKDSDAYSEYLGLGDVDFEDSEDHTDFPMDDRKVTAEIVPFTKNNPLIPPPDEELHVSKLNDILEKPDILNQKRMHALLVTPHRLKTNF